MASSQIAALMRRVAALEKARTAAKRPVLSNSTIDGGAVQATDEYGSLTMVVGKQFDGTSTASVVTGPTPPTPTVPYVTSQGGALRIYWDGTFANAQSAPMDFARVLAYAVPTATFSAPNPLDQASIVGQFSSATGGELTAALDPGVDYVIYLVTWTQPGKYSDASAAVSETVGALADAASVAAAQDAANAAQQAANAADAKADSAAQQAAQAAQDASSADATANAAADQAAQAAGIAAGKGLVLIQSAAPTADQQTATTLWIDTTNGANTPKRWTGSAWAVVTDKAATDAAAAASAAHDAATAADAKAVQASQDAASAASAAATADQNATAAQTAADNASALAGTKNSSYKSAVPPWVDGDTNHGSDVGDVWYDTTLGPGPLLPVISYSVASNVATLGTSRVHGLVVGNYVTLEGVSEALDGDYTVASVPDALTITVATSGVADISVPSTYGGFMQGQGVTPKNTPHVWDGNTWVDVRDSGADAVDSLRDAVVTNRQVVAQVQVTATDAFNTAYAADGRVAISDYEPTAEDVFQLDANGNPVIGPDGEAMQKNNGSLWITRTRDRANLCTNPSFEVSTSGWTGAGAAISRVAVVAADDIGAYAMQIANDTSTNYHFASLSSTLPVSAGQDIMVSAYLRLVSGAASGCYLQIAWLNSTGGTISYSTAGAPTLRARAADGSDEAWQRAYVHGVAPAGAANYQVYIVAPPANASAVWQVDAVLIEQTDRLGRYFDGSSEGGSWLGTAGLSASNLDGGAIIRLFNLEDGSWAEKFWTGDTISSVNVDTLRSDRHYVRPSTLPDGTIDGELIADGSIPVDKQYAPTAVCFEALAAGDIVNVFNSGGVTMIRKAKATSPDYEAHGFVLSAAAAGASLPVYTEGYDPFFTGLSGGAYFLSATAGKISQVVPSTVGYIVQRVGFSPNKTTLDFAPGPAITIGG